MSIPFGPPSSPPPQITQVKPPAYRRRPLQLMAAVVVVVAVVVGVILATSGGGSKHNIAGQVSLVSSATFEAEGSTCSGSGDYSALKAGGYVTLYKDERGDFLGSSQLSAGKLSSSSGACIFTFDFGSVKDVSEYSVVVAGKYSDVKTQAALKPLGYTFNLVISAQ